MEKLLKKLLETKDKMIECKEAFLVRNVKLLNIRKYILNIFLIL